MCVVNQWKANKDPPFPRPPPFQQVTTLARRTSESSISLGCSLPASIPGSHNAGASPDMHRILSLLSTFSQLSCPSPSSCRHLCRYLSLHRTSRLTVHARSPGAGQPCTKLAPSPFTYYIDEPEAGHEDTSDWEAEVVTLLCGGTQKCCKIAMSKAARR